MSSYTVASDIRSISPHKAKTDRSDTTHLSSTAAWREAIPGFIEAGSFSFEGYVHKTQFNTLYTTIFVGRAIYYWKIKMSLLSGESTASQFDFQGFIGEIGVQDIEDEAIMFEATIEITGAATWTSGS